MRTAKAVSTLLLALSLLQTTRVLAEESSPQFVVDIPPAPQLVPNEPDVGAAISPMKKGQVAPFTGVLLSPKATATIIAEINTVDDKIKLEVTRAQQEELAKCEHKTTEMKITADADKKILQSQLDEKSKQLNVLQARLERVEDNSPNAAVWAMVGFGGGVLVTVLTVFAVSQATK